MSFNDLVWTRPRHGQPLTAKIPIPRWIGWGSSRERAIAFERGGALSKELAGLC